ncbi:MAG: PHP domain-containing protein [Gemmatimonadaceae bacterium]
MRGGNAASAAGSQRRMGVVHVHSSYSRDGRDAPELLHDFAVERGIGFVGLTDHAEDLQAEQWDEYVEHCRAASDAVVELIPGLEFRFAGHSGLHLLALGLKRWIAPRTPGEFVTMARGVARLTIVAHPMLAGYRIPEDVRVGIDAIEVWNASYNTRYLPDPRAMRLLRDLQRARPEVVGVAGLDQHDCSNDRETRVVVRDANGDPLEQMRRGAFENVGRTMRFDAAVSLSRARLGMLSAARWAFDGVERVQDRAARSLRRSG